MTFLNFENNLNGEIRSYFVFKFRNQINIFLSRSKFLYLQDDSYIQSKINLKCILYDLRGSTNHTTYSFMSLTIVPLNCTLVPASAPVLSLTLDRRCFFHMQWIYWNLQFLLFSVLLPPGQFITTFIIKPIVLLFLFSSSQKTLAGLELCMYQLPQCNMQLTKPLLPNKKWDNKILLPCHFLESWIWVLLHYLFAMFHYSHRNINIFCFSFKMKVLIILKAML